MKKAPVLLLALCMLLTLCACADSGEKEFEAAKALYDAGDYENAIESLQSLDQNAEIESMIADAQKQLNAKSYEFLFSTAWKDVSSDGTSTIVFHEDGTCDINGESMPYAVEDNGITIAGIYTLNITQEDDMYRLSMYHLSEEGAVFVREEDYDQFIAEHTVELTLDNYLEYYEWVDGNRLEYKDDHGNVNCVSVSHELKLKDVYEARMNLNLSEVDIEYTYEQTHFSGGNLTINFDTLEYSGASYSDTETRNVTALLYQNDAWPVIEYTERYSIEDNGYGDVTIDSKPEIIRVEGQLVIR